jgi:ketosteroid isomerase-like protein
MPDEGGRKMLRLLIVGVAAAVSLSAACGSSAGPTTASANVQKLADIYSIEQIEVMWHRASSTKDLDLMMSLWADNATFTAAGQVYSGKQQIRDFFATKAAPFKPENVWVSETPAYKIRVTVDGDKGTLYFECHYVDVPTRQVKSVVGADQNVARINGHWLITTSVAATPTFSP